VIPKEQTLAAGFSMKDKVEKVVGNSQWLWPSEWMETYPSLLLQGSLPIIQGQRDKTF